MTELFTVVPPGEAFRTFVAELTPLGMADAIQVHSAAGRILARDVKATDPLPHFTRATMDGYALRSADTIGASETLPAYLRLAGEIRMGTAATKVVGPGEAYRIHTGAMLPPGADGVVMVEQTSQSGDEIEVRTAVAPGESVFFAGEDAERGATLIAAGTRLRAAQLGVLCAIGRTTVDVVRRPRVAILSTGDEVVPPEVTPGPGQIRDVNALTVSTLVAQAGGTPLPAGIVPDEEAALEQACRAALDGADALVLSAGSSVSARDLTARVVDRLGRPGVLIHGVALWPGKPTVLAVCGGKPVIGLPGNPMSALVVAWRFLRPLIRFMAGEPVAADGLDEAGTDAVLTANVASRAGREDYVAVTVARGDDGSFRATPVFAKSSGIVSLSRADGLVIVPLDHAGLAAGTHVRVIAL
jgi:molybdopterin molybdotransferase